MIFLTRFNGLYLHNNLRGYDLFLPGCLLMLFTVGLCGLRSALSYLYLPSQKRRHFIFISFCHPTQLFLSFFPSNLLLILVLSVPLFSYTLLFLVLQVLFRLPLNSIHQSDLKRRQRWQLLGVQIISYIIQTIRLVVIFCLTIFLCTNYEGDY